MVETFRMIAVAAVLLWNSIYDWKYKKISISVTLPGIIAAIFFLMINPEFSLAEAAGGVSIGIFLIIVSMVTRGQIGIGDGILCCFTGIACGFFENISMLFAGLLFSAAAAVFLLISKKAERKTEIPFVPFLFIGFCCVQLLKKIGSY